MGEDGSAVGEDGSAVGEDGSAVGETDAPWLQAATTKMIATASLTPEA